MLKDRLKKAIKEASTTEQPIYVTINHNVLNFNGPCTIYMEGGGRVTREEQKGAVKSGQD